MFPGCLLLIQFLSLLINVAADQAPGYSALDNGQGETPCQMMSSIENCSGALKLRDATGASPSPTKCTCTNVYFNVWSACLLSTGTANSLALSNNWTSTCEQQGITLVTDQYSSSNSLGLPPWAFTSLPVNQSFNIAAALQGAAYAVSHLF
ncbi:hypothetical protein BDP27DRAFT_1064445 [Rhodocollybia butyracea]|uniref:Secreted protein n=1 Tax=Rhodocollybia butyracea TaxID=206335 RepID=A0A9P5PM90_9AGAR|nr:hypothetical protein BDP27DRAFT_1064445 [Rhodocollybia butyracea]